MVKCSLHSQGRVDAKKQPLITKMMRKFVTVSEQGHGGVAQMVERSLSMREVRGSMPRTSSFGAVQCSVVHVASHASSHDKVAERGRAKQVPKPGVEPGTFRSSV